MQYGRSTFPEIRALPEAPPPAGSCSETHRPFTFHTLRRMLIGNGLSKAGHTPDGALNVIARRCGQSYWCDPAVVLQSPEAGSDTIASHLAQRTWSAALRAYVTDDSAQPRRPELIGRDFRKGTGKVSKAVRRGHMKNLGKRGGSVHAGNGSSARAVRAKEAKVRRFRGIHGRWPKRSEVSGVSYKVWARVVKGTD